MKSAGGIDVVVVNHRTPDELSACLQSIADFPPRQPHTVTVVHTCPETRDLAVSADVIHDHHWSEIVWEDNLGYNRACNHAAERGINEYIGFLNADTAALAGTFTELCLALEHNPSWGIVGPRQIDSEKRLRAGGIFGPDTKPTIRGWREFDHGQYTDIRPDAVYVSGSFLVMRRSTFDDLTECDIYRSFAEGEPGPWGMFRHYAGDDWLGRHARAHGWGVVYFGPVTAKHEWHRSSPVGGYGERVRNDDQQLLRAMCQAHGMQCN